MNSINELAMRLVRKASVADPSLVHDSVRLDELTKRCLRSPQTVAVDPDDRALLELDDVMNCARDELNGELEKLADGHLPSEDSDVAFPRTKAALRRCLELDSLCSDALMIRMLIEGKELEPVLDDLATLEVAVGQRCRSDSARWGYEASDLWADVFMRPLLRLQAKQIDLLVGATCHREALRKSEEMLRVSPADSQGIRHMAALLYARLEDEEGFNRLDARYHHVGSCWMHLARTLLMYKLGRMPAARRAAHALAELCPGAAWYLLNPEYVQPYLPDRPSFVAGSPTESLLATYEADFLVVDCPDFIPWLGTLPRFVDAAESWGKKHGETI